MINPTYLEIILPLVSVAELALGLIVFFKKFRDRLHQLFGIFSCVLSSWVFANYMLITRPSLFWLETTYGLSDILVISCILWLLQLIDGKIPKKVLIILLIGGLASLTLAYVNDIQLPASITQENLATSGIEIQTKIFFPAFTSITIILLAFLFSTLIRGYFQSQGIKRIQLNYVLIGIALFVGISLFVSIFLPALGISEYSLLDSASSFFFLVFTILAITRLHLFKIKVILTEFLVFILGFILLLLPIFIKTPYLRMITGAIFVLFCIFGYLLIQSTIREIEHKEMLAQKVRERTQSLLESKTALEKALKETQGERDKTSAIINNFADGLVLIQEDNVILINPKAQDIFKVNEKEIISQNILELTKNKKIYPLIRLLLTKGPHLHREELVVKEKQFLEVTTTEIKKGGQEIGKIVILHDITRAKLIERLKRDFVTVAAHQLRTPLTALKWNIDMLLKKDLGPVTAPQAEFLKKANQSNERMVKLVNDLLSSIEIEYGKSQYIFKKEDIIQLTKKFVQEMRPIAERKDLKISLSLPHETVPRPKIDQGKFKIALQNIIDNAIRYSEKGTVKVRCTYYKTTKRFQFRIEDQGIGIAEAQQKRVFTRFFRTVEAMRIETKGSGLGLYTAKNIVHAHGGKIWFQSQKGKGSVFSFSIPVKPQKAE